MKTSSRIIPAAVSLFLAAACFLRAPSSGLFAQERSVLPVKDDDRGTLAAPGQLRREKLPDKPAERVQHLIDRGLFFLKTQQKTDGSWQRPNDPPGVSAIVLRAFVQDSKYTTRTPFIAKGYEKLFSYQLDTGGIYQDMLANYNTAIAVSAIAAAKDPAFQERLDKAVAFLKGLQWTPALKGPKGEVVADKSNPWYGGWGYGNHARPDLSNAQFALEALHDSGLKPTDPAYQAALAFLSRTQNSSETNDQPWSSDDGGFVYTPAENGQSEAKDFTGPDGKRHVRSYGSMTYAGLKSMIYAGLSKDDTRVKAAVNWIKSHWTLEENPGMRDASPDMAQHGLYYYYYVFAHALNAYDEPTMTDAAGVSHDWRIELLDKLTSLQKEDGSWIGEKRWMENNPILTTAYTVLALEEAQRDLNEHPVAK